MGGADKGVGRRRGEGGVEGWGGGGRAGGGAGRSGGGRAQRLDSQVERTDWDVESDMRCTRKIGGSSAYMCVAGSSLTPSQLFSFHLKPFFLLFFFVSFRFVLVFFDFQR